MYLFLFGLLFNSDGEIVIQAKHFSVLKEVSVPTDLELSKMKKYKSHFVIVCELN